MNFVKKLTLFIFFACYLQVELNAHPQTWEEVQRTKKGEIDIYWYTSNPFIFNSPTGELVGIEYEIMNGFAKYLKVQYDIDLKLNWNKEIGFTETYEYMKNSHTSGEFGVSAFSITKHRQQEVLFSDSYMLDVTVLVSRDDVPIMKSVEEFKNTFKELTALTVANTTYEKGLLSIKDQLHFNFKIKYIPSNETILNNILLNERSFAYVDLPLYLIALKNNPSIPIIRQNLFPIKGKGYGILMPKNTDWNLVLNEYLKSDYFRLIHEEILEKYLQKDIYNLIQNISVGENVNADELIILLTKEKEIQSKELLEKALKIQQETTIRYVLIAVISLSLMGLFVFYRLYRSKKLAMSNLEKHKSQIERQQTKIENNNAELLNMNEEKNNLIGVLAHDLRSPINQVVGLAEFLLLENKELHASQQEVVKQIIKSSVGMKEMISKILDVEAMESMQLNIKNEHIQIKEVFDQLKVDFTPAAKKKHIRINFHDENELKIFGDKVFLNQILGNLISNAIKFSNANTDVDVKAVKKETKIEISVADKGPGFTNEDQQNIFKKFKRLSAQPTGGEQSTGLGLSIVKMYVKLMNATITFNTKVGKGTTFILTFNVK
jgi:signal transduction histidine kinase